MRRTIATATVVALMLAIPTAAQATVEQLNESEVRYGATDFYPTVRDGYRDSLRVTVYPVDDPADVCITWYGRAAVRTQCITSGFGGTFVWNGRDDDGHMERAGSYDLLVQVEGHLDEWVSDSFHILKGTRNVVRTLTVHGHRRSNVEADCEHKDIRVVESNDLLVACAGFDREHVEVTYRLTIPKHAHLKGSGVESYRYSFFSYCSKPRVARDVDGRKVVLVFSHGSTTNEYWSGCAVDYAWARYQVKERV